jgi:hypothetical protein
MNNKKLFEQQKVEIRKDLKLSLKCDECYEDTKKTIFPSFSKLKQKLLQDEDYEERSYFTTRENSRRSSCVSLNSLADLNKEQEPERQNFLTKFHHIISLGNLNSFVNNSSNLTVPRNIIILCKNYFSRLPPQKRLINLFTVFSPKDLDFNESWQN